MSGEFLGKLLPFIKNKNVDLQVSKYGKHLKIKAFDQNGGKDFTAVVKTSPHPCPKFEGLFPKEHSYHLITSFWVEKWNRKKLNDKFDKREP